MVTVTPRPTKYSNHYAVPAADLGEGDYIFSRLVTEATEWDGDRTAIEFRLADGSLIVAAPEDVFPAQFPAREDPVDFSEYPEWNGQNFIPKGVKLNKRFKAHAAAASVPQALPRGKPQTITPSSPKRLLLGKLVGLYGLFPSPKVPSERI